MRLAAQSLSPLALQAGQSVAGSEKMPAAASSSEFAHLLGAKVQEIGGVPQTSQRSEHEIEGTGGIDGTGETNGEAGGGQDESQQVTPHLQADLHADPALEVPQPVLNAQARLNGRASLGQIQQTSLVQPSEPAVAGEQPGKARLDAPIHAPIHVPIHPPANKEPGVSFNRSTKRSEAGQHLESGTGKSDNQNPSPVHVPGNHDGSIAAHTGIHPTIPEPVKRESSVFPGASAAPGAEVRSSNVSVSARIDASSQPVAGKATNTEGSAPVNASTGVASDAGSSSDGVNGTDKASDEKGAAPGSAAADQKTRPADPANPALPIAPAMAANTDSRSPEGRSEEKGGAVSQSSSAQHPGTADAHGGVSAPAPAGGVSHSVSPQIAALPAHGENRELVSGPAASALQGPGAGGLSSSAGSSSGGASSVGIPHAGEIADQSGIAAKDGNPFERLDQALSPEATVLQGSSQRLTVGLSHPSLGWVEIKTQSTGDQIAATLVSASSQTHQHLAAQVPSLTQFLSDREVKLSSVTVHQGIAGGGGGGENGGARHSREQNSPSGGNSSQPELQMDDARSSQASDAASSQSGRRLSYIDIHA